MNEELPIFFSYFIEANTFDITKVDFPKIFYDRFFPPVSGIRNLSLEREKPVGHELVYKRPQKSFRSFLHCSQILNLGILTFLSFSIHKKKKIDLLKNFW